MHYAKMDVDWFKTRKSERKVTDTALAEALGVERSVANKIVNGKVAMNARRADAVAELLGSTRDEVLYRAGFSAQPPTPKPDQVPTRSADSGETVEITQLDLSLSMGPGTIIDQWVESEPVTFDLAFIRRITRSPPGRLRLVTGIGRSMEPTLQDGDTVLIDTMDTSLARQDGIYWISVYGASGIKRLRAVGPDSVLVISDNKDVTAQEVAKIDLRIEGRAIWAARGL